MSLSIASMDFSVISFGWLKWVTMYSLLSLAVYLLSVAVSDLSSRILSGKVTGTLVPNRIKSRCFIAVSCFRKFSIISVGSVKGSPPLMSTLLISLWLRIYGRASLNLLRISSFGRPTNLFLKQNLQYDAHLFVASISAVSPYLCCRPWALVLFCSPLVS